MIARIRRFAGSFALLVISLVVGLGLSELLVRWFAPVPIIPQMYVDDPHTIFRPKARAQERSTWEGAFDWTWTTNNKGYRGSRDFEVPKPAGVRRVLVLGDSFTFGFGVSDSQTYSAVLERTLRSECGEWSVEVINAGVSGFSTSQQLALLEHDVGALKPDLVLAGFFVNDPQDNTDKSVHALVDDSLVSRSGAAAQAYTGVRRTKAIVNAIPGYPWLTRHSMLVNWLRRLYFARSDAESPRLARWGMSGKGTIPTDSALEAHQWRLMELLLGRMADVSAGAGSELAVVLLPDDSTFMRYMSGRRHEAATFARMRQVCDKLALRCVDLAASIAAGVNAELVATLYIPRDGHFSATGHRTAAEALMPTVRDLIGCSTSTDHTDRTFNRGPRRISR